ncbi:hypothetical protein [Xylocopilactobacillus apicola]|uniref:WxL domain-containing protein n=1 Tax=Xylocopilactobacillus apicola TaxID=2932184 RepID=A0AAU9DLY6_9LACO|nr:hypothetical protein [Xylocopilactobacillus apicola]BDR59581.1 hypothetical protein XA3_20220 [Xylocopilactobacillus apicola]
MSKKFNKSAVMVAATMLGMGGVITTPLTVFADSAGAAAGGDANASTTTPATNPAIQWKGGGANGSVVVGQDATTATPATGTSIAGISWHTDAASAILSLLAVPNLDFGAWKYTAGADGDGASNTVWYPGQATAAKTGSYDHGGITGTANFAPLFADKTAVDVDTATNRAKEDVDGFQAAKTASAAGSNAAQIATAKKDQAASGASAHRFLAVRDGRAGVAGWKVQLAVGSFDRDGSYDGTAANNDGTTNGNSPLGARSKLEGAAIMINTGTDGIKTSKTMDNLLTGAKAPKGPTGDAAIVYAGKDRNSVVGTKPTPNDPNSTGYKYGDPVTIFSATQSTDPGNGAGGWIMDFGKKNSAMFTSPIEGLGTYTASLQWTLVAAP